MKQQIKLLLVTALLCLTFNDAKAQQEGFLGEVKMFAGNFAPRGWAFCDGQLLPISQNSALFSILGTMYGGDGRTTFALPDLRGRVAMGVGNGPGLQDYRQGSRGGSEFKTLNITEMPSHNHLATVSGITATINVNEEDGTAKDPNGKYIGISEVTGIYNSDVPDGTTKMGAETISVTGGNVSVANNGGNQAFDNRQPYLAIRYIICLQGVFPSRN